LGFGGCHDLLISNQVSKGFEQLASDKVAMQLGGIYALEGVMNTSEQYHGSVLEGLCAYVREKTAVKTATENKPDKPAIDVQAALTVIGRRAKGIEGGKIDLANVSIRGAVLNFANLTGANLSGANLSFAKLTGTDLGGANLSLANLNFADLSDAHLPGANLGGANLSFADLSLANLSGANLSRADLSLADLSLANLSRAENLTQGQLDKACGNADTKLPEGLTLKVMCK
jgi:pentapeptide repeat protein